LRTPANAILGHIELLLSGAAGPISNEVRTSLGDIQRAAIDLSSRLGEVVTIAENLPATRMPDRHNQRPKGPNSEPRNEGKDHQDI